MKKTLLILILFTGLLQISCSEDLVTNDPASNSVDVYVAGQKNSQACYWKNNQLVLLDSGGITAPLASKIIVANNDVYVLGIGVNDTETLPMFWKNGVLTNLKTSLSTTDEEVRTITDFEIIGNDVYFVGYTKKPLIAFDDYSLVYWKNGVKTVVHNYGSYALNHSKIKVANSNIYITGTNNASETINGFYLNNVFNEIPNSILNGLAVNNNEVYAYGTLNNEGYYKNINTNSETTFPATITAIAKMLFDNNNMYFTNASSIYENGVVFDESQPQIMDFKILNGNTYKIIQESIGDLGYLSHLTINGVHTSQIADSDGTFLSLFVVQN
jgi:hypothetical protein